MTAEAHWQRQFDRLKAIIEKRQDFEAKNPIPPYSTHPTDINFPDENDLSLLRYAIRLGQLDTVKELVQNGAVLPNAITYALGNGKLDIARYFLSINNDCSGADLNIVQDEECREWFKNIIKESLKEYNNSSFYENPIITYSDSWQSNKERKTRLERAAEIGALDLIQDYQKKVKKSSYLKQNESLIMNAAISNNEIEVVKCLLANGLPINPATPYQESFLNSAIVFQKENIVRFLIENNADINYSGELKKTALIIAAETGNTAIVETILENKPDIAAQDVLGRTALHYAVIYNNVDVAAILLNKPETADILNYADIYGMTALDYAKEKSLREMTSLFNQSLDSGDMNAKPVNIGQIAVMQKMKYYLRTQYRDFEFFNEEGHCNGFVFLRDLYAHRGMEDYFFETLALMASWDGTDESLNKVLDENLPQKQYYQNLGDLFEQWINDITWFQHSTLDTIFDYKPGNECQEDRQFQWKVSGDENAPKPISISKLKNATTIERFLENIKIFSKRMPFGTRLELGGSAHATTVCKNADNTLSYYDPNLSRRTRPFTSNEDFTNVVIDTKLIMLDKYRKDDIAIDACFFYYDTAAMTQIVTNHNPFSDDEWPQNKEDVASFQNKSPNAYTQLHIAVITGSINSLKKLLEESNCELTIKNKQEKTALDLAIESKNIEMVKTLLRAYPADNLTAEGVLAAYSLDNQEIMEILFQKQGIDLSLVFFSALNRKEYALLSRLLTEQKINTNITYHNKTPLSKAFEQQDAQMLEFLFDHGFQPGTLSVYFKEIVNSVTELQSIALRHIEDINDVDEKGDALMHHLLSSSISLENKKAMIQQLKDLKADLNKINRTGRTPFQLLMSDWLFDTNHRFEVLKMLLPNVTINPSIRLHPLLMESIQAVDNVVFDFLLPHFTPEFLNTYNAEGFCPLHLAFIMRDVMMVDKLLLQGADINIPAKNGGNTCLHRIILTEDTLFLDKFIKQGASFDIQNAKGETARDLLNASNNLEFKEKCLKKITAPDAPGSFN